MLPILVAIVIAKTLAAIWVHFVLHNVFLAEALRMLQFEAMAIGAIAAYWVFQRQEPISANWLFSKPAQILLLSPLVFRLFFHKWAAATSPVYFATFDHPLLCPLLLMALFGWFIVNVSVNERNIFRFDVPALNYLGEISYGIYMYHGLAISLLFVPFIKHYRAAALLPLSVLLHLLVAAYTLLFASLSKKFLEDKFLRYKRRFEPAAIRVHEISHREIPAAQLVSAA